MQSKVLLLRNELILKTFFNEGLTANILWISTMLVIIGDSDIWRAVEKLKVEKLKTYFC